MEGELTLTQRVLIRAAKLISIKENWIQGSSFRTKNGDPYGSYCSLGALYRAAHEELGVPMQIGGKNRVVERAYINSLRMLRQRRGKEGIAAFNDAPSTTYDDVKNLFCKTVRAALDTGDSDEQ